MNPIDPVTTLKKILNRSCSGRQDFVVGRGVAIGDSGIAQENVTGVHGHRIVRSDRHRRLAATMNVCSPWTGTYAIYSVFTIPGDIDYESEESSVARYK
jgi:hypothetical protein